MSFIIDGYNLLWAVQKLNEKFEPVNDVQLCHIIGHYLRLISEKGQIIFDGIGPPDKSGFYNINNLEVIFAGRDVEADTVIEAKINASTAPKGLTIVSSDRELRDLAHVRKAVSIKSDEFWSDVQKQLSRKAKTREPQEKFRGITEGETDQWLKIFGLDQ